MTKLDHVREAISSSAEYKKVAGYPMFIDTAACSREPLVDAGRIDAAGHWVGDGGNAGVMLDIVRNERLPRNKTSSPEPAPSRTASTLTSALPRWSSIDELDRFSRRATSLPGVTDTEFFWITPEELCDIVESAASIADLYFSTFACGNSSDLCRIALRDKSNPSKWLAFDGLYPVPSLQHFINEWDFPPEYQKMRPVLAGVRGRFVMNFQNAGNRAADSKDLIDAASLWPRLYARRANFLQEVEQTEKRDQRAQPAVELQGLSFGHDAAEQRATEKIRPQSEQRNILINYHLWANGQQFGPYTLGQIEQFAREGRCRTSDLVWSTSIGQWIPLSYVLSEQRAHMIRPAARTNAVERRPEEPHFHAEPFNYYIWTSGQQFGPYTLEQLSRFASEGRCRASDLVWSTSAGKWIPLSYVLSQQQATPVTVTIGSNSTPQIGQANSSKAFLAPAGRTVAGIAILFGTNVFAVILWFVIVPLGALALDQFLGISTPWNVIITLSVWYVIRMLAKRYSMRFQPARVAQPSGPATANVPYNS